MRPVIPYYGGKQRLASKIIRLFPRHTVYVEPFCGGAAVFFRKPIPPITNSHHYREVLNDKDGDVVNVYRVLQDPVKGKALIRKVKYTLYSRKEHSDAKRIEGTDIERAHEYITNISMSFSKEFGAGWETGVFTSNLAHSFMNKKKYLLRQHKRLLETHIECDDAISVIKRWDSPQTPFYCDPPYPGAEQGHYSGYTEEDFRSLVDTLKHCKGSFLLSCYGFDAPPDWEMFTFEAHCTSSGEGKVGNKYRERAVSAKELGDRKRVEYVYRVDRSRNARPEVKRIFWEFQARGFSWQTVDLSLA